jgi:hypothetical protein
MTLYYPHGGPSAAQIDGRQINARHSRVEKYPRRRR